MKAVIQRVTQASVVVDQHPIGAIGSGLLVLLGVERGDREADAELLARKVARLRIFEDDAGKMNLALLDTGGSALVVSQFTLLADLRRGHRPGFSEAAPPEQAEPLYERFCAGLRAEGIEFATGAFGARMAVSLSNDGPVTIWMDSHTWSR
jgi:D-tyrosyl-tRNA(Tyr) deacylase